MKATDDGMNATRDGMKATGDGMNATRGGFHASHGITHATGDGMNAGTCGTGATPISECGPKVGLIGDIERRFMATWRSRILPGAVSEREERPLSDPRRKDALIEREQHTGDSAVPASILASVFF